MQPQSIDLTLIKDVVQLKALKSDQYDSIKRANDTIEEANTNLFALNTRIGQLEEENKVVQQPVRLEVVPGKKKKE